MALVGYLVLSFEVLLRTPLLGSSLNGLILLHTSDNFITALALMDVRNRNVNLLADDTTIDNLVHVKTNSALVHVEHNTGAAVVELVGHTSVDGGVDLDINIVSSL